MMSMKYTQRQDQASKRANQNQKQKCLMNNIRHTKQRKGGTNNGKNKQ